MAGKDDLGHPGTCRKVDGQTLCPPLIIEVNDLLRLLQHTPIIPPLISIATGRDVVRRVTST